MVNTLLLDDAIKESGKSKKFLAKKCGMTPQSFRRKRKNLSPFNSDDVDILCAELDIKTLKRKDSIFFAKSVEKMPTST